MEESGADSYTQRMNALVKERTYSLTDDALEWRDDGADYVGRMPYDAITQIRLAYRPSRVQLNRYYGHIYGRGGRLDMTNSSYRGFGDFEQHDAQYSAFMRELHRRLAAKGLPVVFSKGSSLAGYIGNVALTLFIFAMIALAFVLLLTWGMVWIAVAKLAIILFFVPTLIRFILSARPAAYDPLDIPQEALPA
ncbi:MAG: hypothetical protein AB7L41_09790 [Flavobacteriaceae bacterium]